MASVGQSYLYAGPAGVAEMHAEQALHPEMRELDLRPDTAVRVAAVDDERGGLVLIEWTDQAGTARITSVPPDFFDQHFIPGGQA